MSQSAPIEQRQPIPSFAAAFIRGGTLTLPGILAFAYRDNSPTLRLCAYSALVSDAIYILRQLSEHCAAVSKFDSSPPTAEALAKLPRFKKCTIFNDQGGSIEHEEFDLFAKRVAAIFAHLLNGASKKMVPDKDRHELKITIGEALNVFSTCGYILVDAIRGKDIHPSTKTLDTPGASEPASIPHKLEMLKRGHLFQGLELIDLGLELVERHIRQNIIPGLKQLADSAKKFSPEIQESIFRSVAAYQSTEDFRVLTSLAKDPAVVGKMMVDAGGREVVATSRMRGDIALTLSYSSDLHGRLARILEASDGDQTNAKKRLKDTAALVEHCADHLGAVRAIYQLLVPSTLAQGKIQHRRESLAPSPLNSMNLIIRQALLTTTYMGINLAIPFVEALEAHNAEKVAATSTPPPSSPGDQDMDSESSLSDPASFTDSKEHTLSVDPTGLTSTRYSPPPLAPLRVRSTPQISKNIHRGDPSKDPRIQRKLETLRLKADTTLDEAIQVELKDRALFKVLFPHQSANTQFADINDWRDYTGYVACTLLGKAIGEISAEEIHKLLSLHPQLIHRHRNANEFPREVESLCVAVEKLREDLRAFHSYYNVEDKRSPFRVHASVLPQINPPEFDPIRSPHIFRSAKSVEVFRRKVITPLDYEYKILAMHQIDPVSIMVATDLVADTIVQQRRIKSLGAMLDQVMDYTRDRLTRLRVPPRELLTECYTEAIRRYHAKEGRPPLPPASEVALEAARLADAALERSRRETNCEGIARAASTYCSHAYTWDRRAERVTLNEGIEQSLNESNAAIHRIIAHKVAQRNAQAERTHQTTARRQMTRGATRAPRLARDIPLVEIPDIASHTNGK